MKFEILEFLKLLNTTSIASENIAGLALTIKKVDGTETTLQLAGQAKKTFEETAAEAEAFLTAPDLPDPTEPEQE